MSLEYSSSPQFGAPKRSWRHRLLKAFKLPFPLVLMPLKVLFKGIAFVCRFVYAGWKHRKLKHLVFGLPSIAVVMTAVYFGAAALQASPFSLGQAYLDRGQKAVKAKDWESAKLYLERAVALGQISNEAMFDLARAAQATGDQPRMTAVLERLCPDDRPGYYPAHLWKATQILSGPAVTQEQADEAQKHLQYVLLLDRDNVNAHSILGELYFQAGLWQSAVEHLRFSGQRSFHYRLMLAKASAASGNVIAGRSYAESVLEAARTLVVHDPADLESRLAMGEAALLLERYSEAASILQEGMKIRDTPELHQALALVLIHWSDALLSESPDNRLQAFQLLASALEQSPSDMIVFDRLLAMLRSEDETATTAREFLNENIVSGRAAGLSHLILGTDLFEEGQVELAGAHLEQAFRLIPNALIVANNYAWYLTRSETPDIDRALKIIDAVIEQDPERPEFRDTRGHILLAKGDYQSAVAEFEKVLPVLPPSAETHQALAKAYHELGLSKLADSHKQIADRLFSEVARNQRRGTNEK